MKKRIAHILREALEGKVLISPQTQGIISHAIAEYGHLLYGKRCTLGDMAQIIAKNYSKTEDLERIVATLMRFADKYPDDVAVDNGVADLTYYDRYAAMPPEWAPKFAVTGGDPPKMSTS